MLQLLHGKLIVVGANIFLPPLFEYRHGNEEIRATAASRISHGAAPAGVAGFGEDAFGCIMSLIPLQLEIVIEPQPPNI